MKKIRLIVNSPLFCLAIIITFFSTVVAKDYVINDRISRSEKDGKELFKSLMFSDGKYVENIPVLKDNINTVNYSL